MKNTIICLLVVTITTFANTLEVKAYTCEDEPKMSYEQYLEISSDLTCGNEKVLKFIDLDLNEDSWNNAISFFTKVAKEAGILIEGKDALTEILRANKKYKGRSQIEYAEFVAVKKKCPQKLEYQNGYDGFSTLIQVLGLLSNVRLQVDKYRDNVDFIHQSMVEAACQRRSTTTKQDYRIFGNENDFTKRFNIQSCEEAEFILSCYVGYLEKFRFKESQGSINGVISSLYEKINRGINEKCPLSK